MCWLIVCKCLYLGQMKVLPISHEANFLVLDRTAPCQQYRFTQNFIYLYILAQDLLSFPIGTHYFTISFLQMITLRQDEVNCLEFAWIECIIAIFHIDQSVFRVLLTYLLWCLFTAFPSFFVRWISIFYGLFTLRLLRQTILTKYYCLCGHVWLRCCGCSFPVRSIRYNLTADT